MTQTVTPTSRLNQYQEITFMKPVQTISTTLLLTSLLVALPGCMKKEGLAEKVGESLDYAAEPGQEAHVMSDTWISTKVKSTFIYSSNVDAIDIDVSTSNGVVTLSGKVDSVAERALAIELAKNIRGVQSVDSKGLII
jgi:hypothetical protein